MTHTFRLKQVAIQQDQCAMKVGTDAILLGAWSAADTPGNILDIGTGTGIVALMLAQRFPDARVNAVEIDFKAAQQAAENFRSRSCHARCAAVCGIQVPRAVA